MCEGWWESRPAPAASQLAHLSPSLSTTTGIRIASPPTVKEGNGVQVDGGDTRILSLAFANGRLYATCNTAATWSGVVRNSIAYYVITASTRAPVYAGVYGNAAWHAYGGAIAPSISNANAAGFVGFITGSTTIPFASMFGRITVGSGVTYATTVNAAPNGQYLKGFTNPVRTGDYSAACVDPATGAFFGEGKKGEGEREKGGALGKKVNLAHLHHSVTFLPGQFWGASEQGQTTAVNAYNNWGTIIWNALI